MLLLIFKRFFATATVLTCAMGAALGQSERLFPDIEPASVRKAQALDCEAPGQGKSPTFSAPRLKRALAKGTDVRVAIFGSSTHGHGLSATTQAYPLLLQTWLRQKLKHSRIFVDSMGITEETAGKTAERVSHNLGTYARDFIIWRAGVHDAAHRIAAAQFETAVRKTADAARQTNVEMMLVGQKYSPRLAQDVNYLAIGGALERAARDTGSAYVDNFDYMRRMARGREVEDMLANGGANLSDFGHRCMTEDIGKSILRGLQAASR